MDLKLTCRVEKDDKVVEQFRMKTSYDCIKGDATQDELLLKSGIMNAKALITTLPSGSDNLFCSFPLQKSNVTSLHLLDRRMRNVDLDLKVIKISIP